MKRQGTVAALAAIPVFALGCGEDDKKSEQAAKPASLTITASESGKKTTLQAPKTAKAGLTKITVKNDGKRPHSAQMIRISGDQSAEDVLKVIGREGGPIPSWLTAGGGVGTTKPGSTASVTENLEPGRYVVVDDEEEGGKPTTTELEVTGSKVAGNPPKGNGTITAVDYSFTAQGLKTGKNEVLFQNNGKELHHVIAFPFKPGATFDQVKKGLSSEQGRPPVDEKNIVGTSVIDRGRKQLVQLDLKKGKYALVCFIQDRKGGPPHVAKGMIVQTEVK